MRNVVLVATVLVLAALVVPAAKASALSVEPPAPLLVTVPLERCASAESAGATGPFAAWFAEGWTRVGAPESEWLLRLDLERTAALGVSLGTLRERLSPLAEALTSPEAAPELLKTPIPLAVTAKGAPDVPLTALATLERRPGAGLQLTVDGTPVLALGAPAEASWVALVARTVALAGDCGVPLEDVRLVAVWPEMVTWRILYRHAPGTPAEEARTRARTLEGAVSSGRGAGVSLGLHRPTGGAVWGIATRAATPAVPKAEAMRIPGTRVVVQRAKIGKWHQPFLGVVRFEGPGAAATAALAAARKLTEAVGSRTTLVGTVASAPRTLDVEAKKLAKAGLAPEDVALVTDGATLPTPSGAALRVEATAPADLGTLAVLGRKGQRTTLGAVAKVRETPGFDVRPDADGRVRLYVSVPSDVIADVAKAVVTLTVPKDVTMTSVNWKALPDDEKARVLDWWTGL